MKPKARLKITLKCNKRCKYCINNNPEYRKKWTKIDQIRADQRWNKYRSIIVSGGEPTLDLHLLKLCLKDLRSYAGVIPKIYLQTNGYLLTKSLVKELDDQIDGIGYSVHSLREFEHMIHRLDDIARIKPVRLYYSERTFDQYTSNRDVYTNIYLMHRFSFKVWKEGEFDKKEQIFVLKDN